VRCRYLCLILGHLFGFKWYAVISYYGYSIHPLAHWTAEKDYHCQLVRPLASTVNITSDELHFVKAQDLGFKGYNLENRSRFGGDWKEDDSYSSINNDHSVCGFDLEYGEQPYGSMTSLEVRVFLLRLCSG